MIGALDGDPTLVEEGAILNMTGGGYGNSGMGGLTGLVETELLLDAAEDRDYNQGGYGGGNTYVENTYVDNNTYVDQGNGGGGDWDDQYDDGQGNSGGGDWDDQNNWQ